ncbi:MAG TPA: MFS transporter [Bacillota bacterium]|nr:MFS transporter [Bacillota bacterium]
MPLGHQTTSGRFTLMVLLLGQIVSGFGSGLSIFAIQWYVWTRLQSGPALALLWTLVAIPYVTFGPVAGVYVDRWNRRRTIMVADLVNGVLTFVVGLAAGIGHFSVAMVYALIFLVTFIKTFHNPAIYASIPRMVPSEQLPRANSLLEFGLQAPRTIAPAVGAGLLALGWDVYSLLLLDAATFFFASLTLAMVRFPREQEQPASASKAPKKDNSFQEDMGAGMKYLRANRSLLSILLLTAVINLLGSGLNVLLPPLVTDVFQAGPELLGIIQAAMSAGALTGSVLLIVWGAPRNRAGGFIAALIFASTLQLASGLVTAGWQVAVLLGMAVMGWCVADTLTLTIFQEMVPNDLQGRVLALRRSVEQFTWPISLQLTGLVSPALLRADHFLVVAGTLSLASVLLTAWAVHTRRRDRFVPGGEGSHER